MVAKIESSVKYLNFMDNGWILINVFLSGHLHPGYLSWNKWWATTALPSAKPYMKCISASSWIEYIVSTTCNYHTFNTQLLYISPIKTWELPKMVSNWYHSSLDVVNDENHLRELRNSVYHSAVLESLNSETMHFRTYVDINYSYYLHMRNSFLKFWCVFLKYPAYSAQNTIWLTMVVHYLSLWKGKLNTDFTLLQSSYIITKRLPW
jgi:hypothetical protein